METRRLDILSDSTGETAEKVVRAAMLQFPHSGAHIRLHTRVRTKDAARPVLEAAAKDGALVVFTVVSPELREFVDCSLGILMSSIGFDADWSQLFARKPARRVTRSSLRLV